jgi:hypothetical protein
MTTKMYSYKRERAKRLYPEPAIFNTYHSSIKRMTARCIHMNANARTPDPEPAILTLPLSRERGRLPPFPRDDRARGRVPRRFRRS